MQIYILGYRGISPISKIIRWQTRSVYSHVSIEINGINYEAWHRGGVQAKENFRVDHSSGTIVDVLRITAPYNQHTLLNFLDKQIGKKYDYRGVLRFLTRREHPADNRWFCSELTGAAFAEAGCFLQKTRLSYLSPRDVMMTPIGEFMGQRIV